MAIGGAYISTRELKAYARIPDTDDDTQLDAVVAAVSSNIERYCGRQFNDAGSASARVFEATLVDCLHVDDFSTLSGLVVESDTGLDGNYSTTIASSTYDVSPFNGIVEGQTGHPYRTIRIHTGAGFIVNGRPTVQVTAQWGWAAVPADVKQAALIQAARVFGRRESPHGVLGFGDFTVRVSSRLDTDVEQMLRHYRLGVEVA